VAGDMAAEQLFERLGRAVAGRYTLVRELGIGGMATVYLATDVKLGRQVAIKVLTPAMRAYAGSGRFQREVLLAAQLSHPNIVSLFEADEADGLLYYVMEFVEGETLRELLGRVGPLPLEQALRITTEVAEALQYAHHSGVIHRDVKPGNILLSHGHALVSDFGIATFLGGSEADESITDSGVTLGTAQYMSPEQASGAQRVDARSDVYALAAVLYEMLAGEPPFTGPTLQATVARLLTDPPRPIRTVRPHLPPHIERALAAGLAKVPADRPPSAQAFVHMLTHDRQRWARRWWLWTAAALVVLGVVGGARWLLHHPTGSPAGIPAGVPPANSVAVLYFESQSPDTADLYLADGLTEEIIGRLGRIARLAVTSRVAVRRYRGSAAPDPATLGRALGVAYLVAGSVRRTGARLHVAVELVRAADGIRRWGETYNQSTMDVLAIEEDITRAVAGAVAGELVPAERSVLAQRPTQEPAAYDHFLRGNYYLAERTPRAVVRAIGEYQQALHFDPGFAPAPARIALGYALFLDWGWTFPGQSTDWVLAEGFAAADRALTTDSTTADAWMARGFLLSFRNPRTFDGVRTAFARAVALDPRNAEAYHQYGMALLWLGEDSAAEAMYRKALAIEPQRPITLFNLARLSLRRQRARDAARWLDSTLALDPAADYAYVLRAVTRLGAGDLTEARADAETAVRFHAGYERPAEATLALVDLKAADTLAARARIERILRGVGPAQPTVADAGWVARALVALREPGEALDLLERVRPRGARLWFYLRAPDFNAVRDNARFRKLVEESQPG
jgi:eukaryotic-like serine/threonine-protein kinase